MLQDAIYWSNQTKDERHETTPGDEILSELAGGTIVCPCQISHKCGTSFSQRGHLVCEVSVEVMEMIEHNPVTSRAKETRNLKESFLTYRFDTFVSLGTH